MDDFWTHVLGDESVATKWAAREGAAGGGEEKSVTSRWALRGRNIEQKVREAVVAVGSGEGVRRPLRPFWRPF
jgi:hypothetical protein